MRDSFEDIHKKILLYDSSTLDHLGIGWQANLHQYLACSWDNKMSTMYVEVTNIDYINSLQVLLSIQTSLDICLEFVPSTKLRKTALNSAVELHYYEGYTSQAFYVRILVYTNCKNRQRICIT